MKPAEARAHGSPSQVLPDPTDFQVCGRLLAAGYTSALLLRVCFGQTKHKSFPDTSG